MIQAFDRTGREAAPRSVAFLLFVFVVASLLLFLSMSPAQAKGKNAPGNTVVSLPSMPANYVVDLAGIISPGAKERLDGYLQELERKTGAQVIVLTVPSLNGLPIEEFSLDAAEKWKLGQKGKDNGALLLVAPNERRYRFEVGYGLEGTLPDSYVGTLGREYMVPYFKKGDYSDGIELAVSAVAQKIAGNAGVRIAGLQNAPAPVPVQTGDAGGMSVFNLIVTGLVFLVAMGLFLRHPGLFMLFLMGGGFGGGGGGFGGGGFGGGGSFGGGGGGGFGGGGASGGW